MLPASVTPGLERFCGAVQTGRAPVKMLAARTAESGPAPYHYSHRAQRMNHNSHMFAKRTCSPAAASPLLFQADGYAGNHGGRATASPLKQIPASLAGGDRDDAVTEHILSNRSRGRGRDESGLFCTEQTSWPCSGSNRRSQVVPFCSLKLHLLPPILLTLLVIEVGVASFFPFPASKKVHYLL